MINTKKKWLQGRVIGLFSIFILLAPTFVQAQTKWTLRQCIDYALKNNISIMQSEINMEIAKSSRDQSMASMFPSLNGNASQSYLFGRSIDPFTNEFTNTEIRSNRFSLSSQITLFDGFQLQQRLQQSKLSYLSERYTLQKTADDISLNVVAGFLQVLYGREAVKNASALIENSEEQVERTKKLVDAGAVPSGNLLDIESQLAGDELNLVNSENVLENALLSLLQLLNIDTLGIDQFDVQAPDLDVPEYVILTLSVDEIFNQAYAMRPEIKSADAMYQSSLSGLKAAKGMQYPSLSVGASVGTGYSSASRRFDPNTFEPLDYPFSDQLEDNRNESIGISLSIPIFNGWQARNAINQASLGVQSAELNRTQVRNTLRQSIQQAHLDAQAARKTFDARTRAVAALTVSFDYAQKRFDVGLLNSFEFLTARNNLSIAESDLLQAKYDLIFRLKVLEFYMGRKLTF